MNKAKLKLGMKLTIPPLNITEERAETALEILGKNILPELMTRKRDSLLIRYVTSNGWSIDLEESRKLGRSLIKRGIQILMTSSLQG